MVNERTVQSLNLVEVLHNASLVKLMNRSVLNTHQSQKTIYKCITTVGIADNWKVARKLEKEWLDAGKKPSEFHIAFFIELVCYWLVICGETAYFNLFHGSANMSFHTLVSAMGFNMSTYPYYDSGECVLKPWMRDLTEGAGNGLVYNYVEEHELGILSDVGANDQHAVENELPVPRNGNVVSESDNIDPMEADIRQGIPPKHG